MMIREGEQPNEVAHAMAELKRKLGIESRTMHNTSKIDEPKAKRLKMLSHAKRRKAREDAADMVATLEQEHGLRADAFCQHEAVRAVSF